MISAVLSGGVISSSSSGAFSLFEKSRFGEKSRSKIVYSWCEALFLVQSNKMVVVRNSKELSFDQLLRVAKRADKRVHIKFPVFSKLRKKGFILKTALKFGADFRVYDRGVRPGEDHARWLLFPVSESEAQSWYEFAAKNRVAHAAHKNLLIGVLDDEGDVTFFEVAWKKV